MMGSSSKEIKHYNEWKVLKHTKESTVKVYPNLRAANQAKWLPWCLLLQKCCLAMLMRFFFPHWQRRILLEPAGHVDEFALLSSSCCTAVEVFRGGSCQSEGWCEQMVALRPELEWKGFQIHGLSFIVDWIRTLKKVFDLLLPIPKALSLSSSGHAIRFDRSMQVL